MPDRRPRELIAAAFAVIFITIVYLAVRLVVGETPAASSFYGHAMGVVGFILMLVTETFYSLRKRSRLARWGQMSTWLEFHIFTGIVGPYLVLLHSSWKFNGAAGVLTLMTGVIVLSGFVGRYIYTAVPRTADGLMVEATELERQIRLSENCLNDWTAARQGLAPLLADRINDQVTIPTAGVGTVLGRAVKDMQQRSAVRRMSAGFSSLSPAEQAELDNLVRRREQLRRQLGSLQTVRRLLAVWHAVHVPIGLGVFALAFVHIGAAIYYSMLLW